MLLVYDKGTERYGQGKTESTAGRRAGEARKREREREGRMGAVTALRGSAQARPPASTPSASLFPPRQ